MRRDSSWGEIVSAILLPIGIGRKRKMLCHWQVILCLFVLDDWPGGVTTSCYDFWCDVMYLHSAIILAFLNLKKNRQVWKECNRSGESSLRYMRILALRANNLTGAFAKATLSREICIFYLSSYNIIHPCWNCVWLLSSAMSNSISDKTFSLSVRHVVETVLVNTYY